MTKLNKTLKTLTATTAVVAGTLASQTVVKAEEVKPVEAPTNLTQTAPETRVTEAQVAQAEADRDTAAQAVPAAQAQEATAKEVADQADAKVQDLSAKEELGRTITPEKVQAAEEARQAAIEDTAAKDAKATEARVAKLDAEAEVRQATDSVEDAKAKAGVADFKVQEAEARKQEALEATDVKVLNQAIQDAKAADTKVAKAEEAVAQSQTALDQAKTFDAEHAQNLEKAKTEADKADADLKAKSTLDQELRAIADRAREAYNQASKGLYNGVRTDLKLNDQYVEAFKRFMNASNATERRQARDQVLAAELVALGLQEGFGLDEYNRANDYMNDPYLEALFAQIEREKQDASVTKYNMGALPDDVLEEANHYLIDVINSVRAQFGLKPTALNANTLKLAKAVAKEVQDNHYGEQKHYVPGINRAAKATDSRLKTSDVNIYENLENGAGVYQQTKTEIFANLRRAVLRFFYEGHHGGSNSNYGHAKSFYSNDAGTAAAFSFTDLVKLHVLSVPEYGVTDWYEGGKEYRDETYGTTTNTIANPAPDLGALKSKMDKAVADYAKAHGDKTAAIVTYNKAQGAYFDLKQVLAKTPQAQEVLTMAQEALTRETANRAEKVARVDRLLAQNKDAKQKLAQLENVLATARQAKVAADAVLAEAQTALEHASAKLATASQTLEVREAELRQAFEKSEALGKELADLYNARDNYETIKQALVAAKLAQADAHKAYQARQEATLLAKDRAKAAHDAWYTIFNRYRFENLTWEVTAPAVHQVPEFDVDAYLRSQEPGYVMAAVHELPEYKLETPRVETPVTTATTATAPATSTNVSTSNTVAPTSVETTQAKLPDTGEVPALMTVFEGLGLFMSGLGLAVTGRKRRQ